MRSICVSCRLPYRVAEVGVAFEERLETGAPYKLWSADRLRCPGCGNEILVFDDVHQSPIAEHYQDGYAEARRRHEHHLTQGCVAGEEVPA